MIKHAGRLAAALSAAMLLASASPTFATAPTIDVNVVECDTGQGGTGQAEVAAGTAFNIVWNWDTVKLWQEVPFLLSVNVVADIDGKPIPRTFRYWTRPYYLVDADPEYVWSWHMFWKYPYGGLSAGHSLTFTVTPTLRFPVFDGTDWYGRGPIVTLKCTITGAS